MTPRFPGLRFFLLRAVVRCRRAAKRAVVGATYGCAVAWSVMFATVYTPFAWVVTGAVMVVTTVFAACCWLVSGE